MAGHSLRRARWFDHVAQQVRAAHARVALTDLSVFSKFEFSGPDVGAFRGRLGANAAPRPGRVGLIHALTPAGGVAAEFTVARRAADHAWLTSAAGAEEIDHDLLRERRAGMDLTLSIQTEGWAVIHLMGPRAGDVLAAVCDDDIGDFAWRGVRALSVSVFTALETAGQGQGIGLFGAFATDSVRLEKGYRAWGAGLTTERMPLESGLAHLVRAQARDFISRAATLARQAGAPWQLVLLKIAPGPVDLFHAHPVWQGDRAVGLVRSGA